MTLVEAGPTLEVGWAVIGGDGERIAKIEEIGPGYVMIRVGLLGRQRLYVPIGAMRRVDPTAGSVSVEPTSETIGSLGWEEKPTPYPLPDTSLRLEAERVRAALGLLSAANDALSGGETGP